MSTIEIRKISRENLGVKENYALNILENLSLEKFNQLKKIMKLGEPGIIGLQTLKSFISLCREYGFDFTESGVNTFKEQERLGNEGTNHGVIGEETANVYYEKIINYINSSSFPPSDIIGEEEFDTINKIGDVELRYDRNNSDDSDYGTMGTELTTKIDKNFHKELENCFEELWEISGEKAEYIISGGIYNPEAAGAHDKAKAIDIDWVHPTFCN